jgi:hypothetical protein
MTRYVLLLWLRRVGLLALLAILVLFDPPWSLHRLVLPLALAVGVVTVGLTLARQARRLWWGYAAYVAVVAVAAAASGAIGTRGAIVEQVCFLLLVWSVADEAERGGVTPWTMALLVCLALILPQLAGPQSVVIAGRVYTYRAVQQWSGYPEIGLLCLLGLAGTWALSAVAGARLLRAASVVLAASFTLALLVLQSRAALVVAGLVVVWVAVVAAVRWRLWASAVLVSVVLMAAGVLVARQPALVEQLVPTTSASADHDRPLGMRLEYWRETFAIIRAHPWVGVGPGQFQQAHANLGAVNPSAHAHNVLLHVASESGVPAMVLYGLLWVRVLVRTWRGSGKSHGAFVQFAVHAMLVAFFLRSLTDHFLSGLDTSFRMLCLVAFLFGVAEGRQDAAQAFRPARPVVGRAKALRYLGGHW